MFDNEIIELIEDTHVLNSEDKVFLNSILSKMSSLERFKLRLGLKSNESSAILSTVQLLKLRYPPEQKQANSGFLGTINKLINPPQPQKLVSPSIMSQPNVLGSTAIPQPVQSMYINEVDDIQNFSDLLQLSSISQEALNPGSEGQNEMIINNLLEKFDKLFDEVKDLKTKRSFFASFLQSPLFSSYINSGITAMSHSELQPREVVLNTLHGVSKVYLKNKTFEMTSIITNHLRHLSGI